jgi:hypothetical protein
LSQKISSSFFQSLAHHIIIQVLGGFKGDKKAGVDSSRVSLS